MTSRVLERLVLQAGLAFFILFSVEEIARAASDLSQHSPSTGVKGGELPSLRVQGRDLVADGRLVRLRGLNWGWWHLAGTRYSEVDMQNVARWGANAVRLAFSYNDLESEGNPPVWNENGFKQLDEVVQWGRRYGIYIILDMHVVPGGQSSAQYCAGGHNLLWTNAASQSRFGALWRKIALRYRDRPEVAAYELMNEPGSPQKTPELLHAIDQRAINVIRAVDPAKIIVVAGDHGSGPGDLTEAIKFDDKNVLYTFHWYEGSGGNEDWISTDKADPGISGSRDWMKVEKTFTAPARADHMSVILRSISNTGSAWFDDVEVDDLAGKVVCQTGFNSDTQSFHPEAFPEMMNFDPAIGHDKTGSLKEHGSTGFNDWAGWVGERVPIHPGQPYHVSAWVKAEHATGDTYMGAEFFRINTQVDPAAFRRKIIPAEEFARKFNVPVWVGEFGCDASNKELQTQWVNASIALFETGGFDWTYWNDKETSDPNGMGVAPENKDGSDGPVNKNLLAALRAGWALK